MVEPGRLLVHQPVEILAAVGPRHDRPAHAGNHSLPDFQTARGQNVVLGRKRIFDAFQSDVFPFDAQPVGDESGDALIEPPATGEVEGRAAFFDLSLDGRWGGVISGDKVRATWEPCACGNFSPSIDPNIQRYADMASGDKIACSGTIDAYVRGVT